MFIVIGAAALSSDGATYGKGQSFRERPTKQWIFRG